MDCGGIAGVGKKTAAGADKIRRDAAGVGKGTVDGFVFSIWTPQ